MLRPGYLLTVILIPGFICAATHLYAFNVHASLNSHQLNLHQENICGVTANFTPGKDSVILNTYFTITFTNTSTNADAIKWYVDGFLYGSANSIVASDNKPGVYEVMLIAYKGSCTDTMRRYFILPGTQPPNRDNIFARYGFPAINDYSSCFTEAKSGGYLIGGHTFNQDHGYTKTENGMLIKIAESGCIDWSRTMNAAWTGRIYNVKGLSDGSFVVSGHNDNVPYLLKLDQSGALIWSRRYSCFGVPAHILKIEETEDGGLVLLSLFSQGMNVIRTDANGSIRWNKFLNRISPLVTNVIVGGAVELYDDLYVSYSMQESGYNLPTKLSALITKLDDSNGGTVWTKKYQTNGDDISLTDIQQYGTGLMVNSFVPSNASQNRNNGFIFLDANGNVTRSFLISTPVLTYSVQKTSAHVISNGGIMLVNCGTEPLQLQPYFTNHTIFTKFDSTIAPRWSKDYSGLGTGQLRFSAIGSDETIAAIGDEGGAVITPYSSSSFKIKSGKIDSSGNNLALSCGLVNQFISVSNANSTAQDLPSNNDTIVVAAFIFTPIGLNTVYPEVRYLCPQEFIDSCSFIKLTGDRTICNHSNNYTYEVHKNDACGQPVKWELTGSATVISKNDSAITVHFPGFGQYTIAAILPFTCVPVKDSLVINVSSKYPPPDLGKDTSICGNNSLVLHAGKYFASYEWQDGTADSTFQVNLAGTYWVTVKDSCDNIFSDTIMVSQSAAASINAGLDRNKCNVDTIHLQAPPGFMNYQWSPSYNISSLTAPLVTVNPDVDTFYLLKAEKTPGCFAFDTVHITVNHSPQIDLGKDTSICRGDSLSLYAGAGFATYSWNTGAYSASIFIKAKGTYSVTATTIESCTSKDTITLLNVFSNPVVNLGSDNKICIGSSKELDAGNFVSYLWNTGGVSRRITISDTGLYSVKVTDQNNCSGVGSINIPIAYPIPSGFLPADTAICTYGTLNIIPKGNFISYNWISGEHTNTLIISKPGLYWLQVTDNNNCIGKDTIMVGKKDCMMGFYIPNAFSPNGDRKNDTFRPLLFGNIQSYHFVVYDRWGAVIFDTTEPGKGWDGRFRGLIKEAGTYVWMCVYQLQGQEKKVEKGTVQLLR